MSTFKVVKNIGELGLVDWGRDSEDWISQRIKWPTTPIKEKTPNSSYLNKPPLT